MTNNQFNILILSAGRRVELIKFAKQSMQKRGVPCKVFAADASPYAAALFFADGAFTVPRILEGNYVDTIIRICRENGVKAIIPTIDTELIMIAQEQNRIEKETGAIINISSLDTTLLCRDKIAFTKFLLNNEFYAPALLGEDPDAIKNYPVFIKPKDGSSSIGAIKVDDEEAFRYCIKVTANPIVQEYIKGEEYTVDIFTDDDCNPISVVPRLRMATRSGEILRGKLIKDKDLIDSCARLARLLKLKRHNTIQCIKNDKIYFIEVNPRFGGGAPMSMRAGADSIYNLYRMYSGEQIGYQDDIVYDVYCSRYDETVFFNEKGEVLYL